MNIKEIYFNNKVYRVATDNIKHINKVDVAQLEEDLIVFYSDQDKCWKQTSLELQTLYTNMVSLNVKHGTEVLKLKSNSDDVFEILDKKVAKVKIETIVVCEDVERNIWTTLSPDVDLYKLYKLFEQNRSRMNAENKIINRGQ
tara:strand:- start:511 stop:939 length:429 start_codon:yes stop_codon:yes gene_type:complete